MRCVYDFRPVSPLASPKKSHSTDSLDSVASNMTGRKVPPPLSRVLIEEEAVYIPELEEMPVSSVVSRKGYLNFLEKKVRVLLNTVLII